MSIVAVHGPNTMFTTEGGGTPIQSSPAGATATKSGSNGLVFNFAFPNPGARPAADFDWTFTGPGSPAAQADKTSGTVTFTGAGAVTIICTVAAGAGPPAGGTYTVTSAATAGTPRSGDIKTDIAPDAPVEEEAPIVYDADGGEEDVELDTSGAFDPGDHTVPEVEEYVAANPDELETVYDLEVGGKNRSTLISHLESLFPFDPADYSVEDVKAYVEDNPDEAIDVLNLEREGKNRTTLVSFLEEISTVE